MAAPSALQGIGQANAADSRVALFLKIFAGEVLAQLDHKLIVLNTTTVKRDLTGAKVASFPTFGDAGATYHTPGEDLLVDADADDVDYLSNIKVGEHLIYADRVLQSSILLDELEEALSHWDARSKFAQKLTTAVGEQTEDNLFRLITAASGLGTTEVLGTKVTGWPGSTAAHNVVTTTEPTVAEVYDGVYTAAELFDTDSIPKDRRFAAVNASYFYQLLRMTTASTGTKAYEVVMRDYIADGKNGDLANPDTMGVWIGNVFVMQTNGIPVVAGPTACAFALNSTDANLYAIPDMTKLIRLLVWTDETIGTVRVRSPRLDVNWLPTRLSNLITLSQAVGHGVLRPEAAYTMRQTT